MRKNKQKENEITEDMLINELQYLVNEGFVEYDPVEETYRLKTKKELKEELKNVL
jgi:DNA-binding HxlR family transcriptional regulator